MTATDEMRRLLDERGVEHFDGCENTLWGYEQTSESTGIYRYSADEISGGFVNVWLHHCTPEQAIAATLGPKVTGNTSDGYHTFNELYHHRAVLLSVIVRDHRELAWKSMRHHDGTMYDGMFIVGIETPEGQATYHYDIDPYWDMFNCKELDQAPEWDGHTPSEAIERIATLGSCKCSNNCTNGERTNGTCRIRVQDNLAETEGMGDIWLECDACGWQMPLEPSTPRFNYCPNCGRRVEVDE